MKLAISAKFWLLSLAGLAVMSGALIAGFLSTLSPLPYPALIRGFANLMATVALGLCALPWLEEQKQKAKLHKKIWRILSITSALWALCELLLVNFNAADNLGVKFSQLSIANTLEYLTDTSTGRISALVILCTSSIAIATAIAFYQKRQWSTLPFLALTSMTTIALPLTGHLSRFTLGSFLIAAHVLAASLWCGALIAIALVASGRSDWARLLPRYSQLAQGCVSCLGATGILSAFLMLDSPATLVTSGYGRIILAKTLMLVVLIALAWQYQKYWLPSVRSHQLSNNASFTRAGAEICLMALTLGLAATLSTTG